MISRMTKKRAPIVAIVPSTPAATLFVTHSNSGSAVIASSAMIATTNGMPISRSIKKKRHAVSDHPSPKPWRMLRFSPVSS